MVHTLMRVVNRGEVLYSMTDAIGSVNLHAAFARKAEIERSHSGPVGRKIPKAEV